MSLFELQKGSQISTYSDIWLTLQEVISNKISAMNQFTRPLYQVRGAPSKNLLLPLPRRDFQFHYHCEGGRTRTDRGISGRTTDFLFFTVKVSGKNALLVCTAGCSIKQH